MRIIAKRALSVLAIASVLIFLWIPLKDLIKTSFLAARLVSEFAVDFGMDNTELPSFIHNLASGVRNEVKTEEVFVPSADRLLRAQLYLPSGTGHKIPAMVFSYGAADPSQDERIDVLARAFARSGIAVLVPEFPEFIEWRLSPQTARDLVASFEFLEKQEFVEKEKIGFLGFCIGGSLALIAASDPQISQRLAYVIALSPYYDVSSVGTAVFSRQYQLNGRRVFWIPHEKSVFVLQNELLALVSKEEAKIIRENISRSAFDGKEIEKLSPDARIILSAMQDRSPEKLKELFGLLSFSSQAEFLKRSPSAHLSEIRAPIFLANASNEYIPRSEVFKLAEALGERAEFTNFDIFSGGTFQDLSLTFKLKEGLKLWNLLRKVLLAAT